MDTPPLNTDPPNPWVSQFETYSQELVSSHRKEKKLMDVGYAEHGDSFWTSVNTGAGDKDIDYREALNYSLFNDQLCGELQSQLKITVPWVLTPQQLEDGAILDALELIDLHLSRINFIIRSELGDLSPADYQRKVAIALFAFCLTEPRAGRISAVNAQAIQLLTNEGLGGYALWLQEKGGLGLGSINQDCPIEGTAFDALKNKNGFCTELSYAYKFIGDYAGLSVGFMDASIDSNGSDHMLNKVSFSDGTFLKIDLGQEAIDKKYSREMEVSLVQTLQSYVSNKIADLQKVKAEGESLSNLILLSVALDPSSAQELADYANSLATEARELKKLGDNTGSEAKLKQAQAVMEKVKERAEDNYNISYNLGIFYDNHPQFGSADPFFEEVYRVLGDVRTPTSIDEKASYADYAPLASAAYCLGKYEEAFSIYEIFMLYQPTNKQIFEDYSKAVSRQVSEMRKKGDWDAALAVAKQYTKNFPYDALGYSLQGGIYFDKKDWENAARQFAEAAKLNPAEPTYASNRDAATQNGNLP